jgi:hypothetical protein
MKKSPRKPGKWQLASLLPLFAAIVQLAIELVKRWPA